jgi:tetratricopeptide (TPR) repeat protein
MQILDEFYKYASKDTSKLHLFKKLLNDFVTVHQEGFKPNKYLSTHYLKVKDLPKAKKHLIIALNDKKNVLEMWETLISIDLSLKDYVDMENHSTEAIEYFPTQPELFFYKALAKENQNKLTQAVDAYENGLSMIFENSPLKINFLNALGDLNHKMKNYSKSDMYFEQLLDIEPTNALALNNHAYYLSLRNEKLEYALQLAERALKRDPKNPSYLDTYGWILYQKGDYNKAIKYLLDAEQLLNEPNNEIFEHIAETYLKLGKKQEAETYKQKIKK